MMMAFLVGTSVACTTLIAGKDATQDGSVLASHSNDGGGDTDPRLVRVPARTFGPGEMRPVYFAPESYPRYVGVDRQVPEYFPNNTDGSYPESKAIGHIPQVSSTFSYWEQTYGAMNEHQVGIGESTCSGVFGTKPIGQGGKALLSVDTLSQIAMERAKTSRHAVQIMGGLAEKYGFYGAGSFEGSAESLMVTDPNEGFIFHILPDPNGTSAIWVAQRVPDDEIGVVANCFVIREVNLSDTHQFLGSKNMHQIALQHKLWNPHDGPLDFTKTFSDGEYAHKYYSGRRMWGAYHLLARNQAFGSEYNNLKMDAPYPATTKPDQKVEVGDFFTVHRYVYQGTPFSLTQGMAGGAFGTPDRYGGSSDTAVAGSWERAIGLYRTSDSYVTQSRSWLPNHVGGTLWFGPHAAHGTVYVPFGCAMTDAVKAYSVGAQRKFDRSTAFWAHRSLLNIAQIRYRDMSADIRKLQKRLESASLKLQSSLSSADTDPAALQRAYTENALSVVKDVWAASDKLLFKFADGMLNEVKSDGSFLSKELGYPSWWLRSPEVNYTNGPPPEQKVTIRTKGMSGGVADAMGACNSADSEKACEAMAGCVWSHWGCVSEK